MVAGVKHIGQVGAEVWDGFVDQHALGNLYHSSKWHEVIEKTYGYTGSYCTVEEGNHIVAALPFVLVRNLLSRRRLVSYPFSDTCDPLVEDGEQLEALIGAIEQYREDRHVRSAEIRTYRLSRKLPGFALDGPPRYCNFVLRLDDNPQNIFRSFHKNCIQRGIRKAGYYHIEITEGKTFDDMRTFYDLHIHTRKRHGTPPQPLRFFRNLWNTFYPSKELAVLLAWARGIPLAGVITLRFKDTVYYKFAAAEKRYMVKRPNHLLLWRIIEDAMAEGYRYLDLGRTFVKDTGLMRWKARWGALPRRLDYVNPVDCIESRFTQQGTRTNTLLGNIVKNMPCCAVRLTGELFYRYLA